jgi:hypothetical protein
MSPANLPLNIRIGDTETISVAIKDSTGAPVNITGRTYAAQIRTTTDAATPMTFDTTEESDGVAIGTPTSRIVIANAGTYNIQFSAQIDKTDGGSDDVTIWLDVDGNNVARSATDLTIPNNPGRDVAAWNWVYTFTAGQYFRLMWSTPDNRMRLLAAGTRTGPVRPAVPSVILTVTQVQ